MVIYFEAKTRVQWERLRFMANTFAMPFGFPMAPMNGNKLGP